MTKSVANRRRVTKSVAYNRFSQNLKCVGGKERWVFFSTALLIGPHAKIGSFSRAVHLRGLHGKIPLKWTTHENEPYFPRCDQLWSICNLNESLSRKILCVVVTSTPRGMKTRSTPPHYQNRLSKPPRESNYTGFNSSRSRPTQFCV